MKHFDFLSFIFNGFTWTNTWFSFSLSGIRSYIRRSRSGITYQSDLFCLFIGIGFCLYIIILYSIKLSFCSCCTAPYLRGSYKCFNHICWNEITHLCSKNTNFGSGSLKFWRCFCRPPQLGAFSIFFIHFFFFFINPRIAGSERRELLMKELSLGGWRGREAGRKGKHSCRGACLACLLERDIFIFFRGAVTRRWGQLGGWGD